MSSSGMDVSHFTVGWICALPIELAAATLLLDERYERLLQNQQGSNIYKFGRIKEHKVVLACLPSGQYGTSSAATVAKEMHLTFPALRFGLMVGIGGGVPSAAPDMRLGDVVISKPNQQFGGVVQYDIGRTGPEGQFERVGSLSCPPPVLLNALAHLEANILMEETKISEYLSSITDSKPRFAYQGEELDVLYKPTYNHVSGPTCAGCSKAEYEQKRDGMDSNVKLHFGTIASGNKVIKDAITRDRLSSELGGILAFEMEAAGLMNHFPCLVIRGICDYADSHKNKVWQPYAAATAAATAKEILNIIPGLKVMETRTVKQVIAEEAKPIGRILIPFPRNEQVVIRTDIFTELDKKLPKSTGYQTAALWGLGGSGKTQVALEFAFRRYDQIKCSIFWVHADNYEKFVSDYKRIANKAGLPKDLENEDLLNAVRDWIESEPNWLLVLDNADDLYLFRESYGSKNLTSSSSKHLDKFIPHNGNGTILWTTRDQQIVGGLVAQTQGVNISSMTTLEAEMLLKKISNCVVTKENSIAITELVKNLGNLPLAVSAAAAYISRSMPIEDYLKRLNDEKKRWDILKKSHLDSRHDPENRPGVLETYQISIDFLRQDNPLAYKILHIIAYFDNQEIPFDLICASACSLVEGDDNNSHEKEKRWRFWRKEKYKEVKAVKHTGRAEDRDSIRNATLRLQELSFLLPQKVKNDLQSYEMHKLVQDSIHYALSTDNQGKDINFPRTALQTMAHVFPNVSKEDTKWKQCEILLPHALRVSNWDVVCKEKDTVLELLNKVSNYLYRQQRSQELEQLDKRLITLYIDEYGGRHSFTLTCQGNLALTYRSQGRFQEAENLEVEVLQLRKDVLGSKHPDTLSSMANLGTTYYSQDRFQEAKKIMVEVLQLLKEVLGSKHPETLWSMAILASTYYGQGRFQEAEKLQVEVLQLRKELLGSKHPDTLKTMAGLGATYYSQGRFQEAEKLEVEVLQLCKEVLGSKHPDTLSSMANLGTTYYSQDRFQEAKKIMVEVLQLRKEVLSSKHPNTLQSMADLAVIYHSQGRFQEAEKLEVEVLQLCKEVLGSKHPDTLQSMADLAVIYHSQGRFQEAEKLEVEVLQLCKEVLGSKHPDTLQSMANLRTIYQSQGRFQEAGKLEADVLHLRKEVLGDKTPISL